MSHYSTSHHHCTTFHITLLHTSAPFLTSVLQHISPRTTIFYIWDHITLQSAWATPFHTISWSTSSTSHSRSLHLTPFHIHNYSTPHPHSTSQHISHHNMFHIALHHHVLILHHTTTSTYDIAQQSHHIVYATFFITTIPHHHISHHIVTFHIFALCNIPRTRTIHSTPHHIPHHTFCILSTPCLKLRHSTSHHTHHISHRTIIHIKSYHHISATFHLTPRQTHHHIQI